MVPEKQSTSVSSTNEVPNDEMRIAWRYNNLDKVDSEQGGGSQRDGKNAYTFDLSQSIEDVGLASIDVTLFGRGDEKTHSNEKCVFSNPVYVSLFQKLQQKLSDPEFEVTNSGGQMPASATKKNLLRICIESLGSPLWYGDHFAEDICLFLAILKAAVRTSLSVCCITIPAHLFKYIVSNTMKAFKWHSNRFPLAQQFKSYTIFPLKYFHCRTHRLFIVFAIWLIIRLNWNRFLARTKKQIPSSKSTMDCSSFEKWPH